MVWGLANGLQFEIVLVIPHFYRSLLKLVSSCNDVLVAVSSYSQDH